MPVFSPNLQLQAAFNTVLTLDYWDQCFYDAKTNAYYSPGYLGPTYLDNPWSSVLLGGLKSPGLAELTCTRERAIDKRHANGVDVGTVTILGILPALFEINITIWTPDQWFKFKSWLATFVPKTGKGQPDAFAASHPVLTTHNITALQVIGITGPHHHSIPRAKTITLKCVEWVAPQIAKKSAPKTNDEMHYSTLEPVPMRVASQGFLDKEDGGFNNAFKQQLTPPKGDL